MLGNNPCSNKSVYDELPLDLRLELFYQELEYDGHGFIFNGKKTLERSVLKVVTPLNPLFFSYLKE